jgi:hypothetical protein
LRRRAQVAIGLVVAGIAAATGIVLLSGREPSERPTVAVWDMGLLTNHVVGVRAVFYDGERVARADELIARVIRVLKEASWEVTVVSPGV